MEQCCEYLSVRCIWLHVLTVSFYRILTIQLNHIWPAWLNGWDFIYELSGSGFESNLVSSLSFGYCSGDEVGFGSRCSHLNFRYCAFFKQRVPWHSGNYRMWIHSKLHTWHDKNIQSKLFPISSKLKFNFQSSTWSN